MNLRDNSTGRAQTADTWFSGAALGDPNAALLASIKPAPELTLETLIRKRAQALSLSALAHRLQRRLPALFASRRGAERTILAAIGVLGVGLGALLYVAAASTDAPASGATAGVAGSVAALSAAEDKSPRALSHHVGALRVGQTEVAAAAPAPVKASTVLADSEQQPVRSLEPAAPTLDPQKPVAKARAKSTWKKQRKSSARRSPKNTRRPQRSASN